MRSSGRRDGIARLASPRSKSNPDDGSGTKNSERAERSSARSPIAKTEGGSLTPSLSFIQWLRSRGLGRPRSRLDGAVQPMGSVVKWAKAE